MRVSSCDHQHCNTVLVKHDEGNLIIRRCRYLDAELNFFTLFFSSLDSDYEETLASVQCGNRTKMVENATKTNEVHVVLKIHSDICTWFVGSASFPSVARLIVIIQQP